MEQLFFYLSRLIPDLMVRSTSYESSLKQNKYKRLLLPLLPRQGQNIMRLFEYLHLFNKMNQGASKTTAQPLSFQCYTIIGMKLITATLVVGVPLFSHRLLLLVTSTGFRSCQREQKKRRLKTKQHISSAHHL